MGRANNRKQKEQRWADPELQEEEEGGRSLHLPPFPMEKHFHSSLWRSCGCLGHDKQVLAQVQIIVRVEAWKGLGSVGLSQKGLW